MTDVARRQARTQKQRLDTALLDRRRREALADLGEQLYELAVSGEIELDELPELARAVQEVEEIDRRIAEAEQDASADHERRGPVVLRPTDRGGVKRETDGGRGGRAARDPGADQRVWRPPMDPPVREPRAERGTEEPGDGRAHAREPRDTDVTPERSRPERSPPERRPRDAAPTPSPPAARPAGGIVFLDDDPAPGDGDDSLDAYMNDDDVPPRG